MQIVLERPRTKTERDRRRYWERLREVDALVRRDIELIARTPRRMPVVDAGCGNGGFVRACRAAGIEAIGVEAFAESVEVAAATFPDRSRATAPTVPNLPSSWASSARSASGGGAPSGRGGTGSFSSSRKRTRERQRRSVKK